MKTIFACELRRNYKQLGDSSFTYIKYIATSKSGALKWIRSLTGGQKVIKEFFHGKNRNTFQWMVYQLPMNTTIYNFEAPIFNYDGSPAE